ncbi:transcriptional regulator, MarR family [Desulfofarcimen acetoxidans DSM 771]|uniref:Transcriptional regulator, MarR family n=1 Tax=Desulfofarcimen acetoxidans (strain ATCC 49208 / DSM 771 / KCTC 5769 / VKM B-1644 / 5575) TaxID=485916 RepID=C8W6L7_DESAS|nr:MarR family transcriptional regulator [Desulfofarcimen acetoxidans]ACV64126.1 transcriptional regulator, MarR family [Desulfofarcimen acetoxidans DSM 771]
MLKRGGKPSPDFYIRNIAIALRCIEDQKLSEFGITNQQARLLGAIRRSLFDGANMSRKYLEDLMGLRGPSVTSLLNGLEKNGFIIRYAAQDDGRAMQIKVTEKGDKIIDDINQVFLDTEKQLFSGMAEDEKEMFITLLYKALANVSTDFAKEEPPNNIHRQQT